MPLARIVSTSHRDHKVLPDLPRPRARISRRRAVSCSNFSTAFVFMGLSPFGPTHQTRARREELMRICALARFFAEGVSAGGHTVVGVWSHAGRAGVSQKQQKTLTRTNAPLVQVRFAERAFRAPEAPALSAFRNGPISAWRGGPLKCAGVCV